MTYELAKQLKDAGFPQDSDERYENRESINRQNDYYNGGFIDRNNPGEDLANPTLSELIEACGDGFVFLARNDDGTEWKASSDFGKPEEFGATPEEAVAKLWLALNEKSLSQE